MRKLAHWVIPVMAVAALGFDAPKSDQEMLQGDWKTVSAEQSGKADEASIGNLIRIDGEKLLMIYKNDPCETCEFVVTLFPNEDPKEIDLKYSGPDRDDIEPGGDTMRGIYRLDGDKLVICVGIGGGDRPTEFKTTKDDQAFLDNLERVK